MMMTANQLPCAPTSSESEPMVVNHIGTNPSISPPSEINLMSPSHDNIVCSDPTFDIDDVHMESCDENANTDRAILSRG